MIEDFGLFANCDDFTTNIQ